MSVIWRDAPTQSVGPKCDPPLSAHVRDRLRAVPLVRYYRLKRWLDRAAALVLLIPGVPVIAVLTVLIRLTSRGPGLYSQPRVGKNGRTYVMYKLRSMRCDAEAKSGPTWSTGDDPRITKLGKVLRKLHLDELPQLWNVLKGEMSLIGPRPERPEFVEVLATEIPEYVTRLAVEPGVTGLAQINLPADTDFDSVRRKLVLDQEYIANASLWLDFRIFACTLLRVVGLPGERAMTMTGVHRTVNLPPSHDDVAEPTAAVADLTPGEPQPTGSDLGGISIKPVTPREKRPVPVARLLQNSRPVQRKDKASDSAIRRRRASSDSDSGIHGTLSPT